MKKEKADALVVEIEEILNRACNYDMFVYMQDLHEQTGEDCYDIARVMTNAFSNMVFGIADLFEEPEEECFEDYNEDMGYDPYMGCYTDDC